MAAPASASVKKKPFLLIDTHLLFFDRLYRVLDIWNVLALKPPDCYRALNCVAGNVSYSYRRTIKAWIKAYGN